MPEIRQDPISGHLVIIAPERSKRPNEFHRQPALHTSAICPFCPGHEAQTPPEILSVRDSGAANEPGWRIRVVPNKYPALQLSEPQSGSGDLLSGYGAHEVIIEGAAHDQGLTDLSAAHIEEVLIVLRNRVLAHKSDPHLSSVLIFKNHGEAAGASLEHTHCQLLALPLVPKLVLEEVSNALRLYEQSGRCAFCELARTGGAAKSRLVVESAATTALVPYAARFPYETWVVPQVHHSHFEEADTAVLRGVAQVLRAVLRKLNHLLDRPAYNLVLHSAPLREALLPHYHWHLEIIPRLGKLAGFELGAGFSMNVLSPEAAAHYLRLTPAE